jgi:hypothetical protein
LQITDWLTRHETDRFHVIKVIFHQFRVKKCFPGKINLEYGGTFTKLFMHVSSRNMFRAIRNLQIRVHIYRPRHCCGDWLTHIRIIAPKTNGSHDMKQTDSSIIIVRNVCVLTSASMIVYLFVTRSWSAIIGTKQPKAIILMWYTRNIFVLANDIFSSTEQCAWATISPKEFKSWVTRISFALLYGKTELSAVFMFWYL